MIRKETAMKTIIFAAILFLATPVFADPVTLTDAQMDGITAAGTFSYQLPTFEAMLALAIANSSGPYETTSTSTDTGPTWSWSRSFSCASSAPGVC